MPSLLELLLLLGLLVASGANRPTSSGDYISLRLRQTRNSWLGAEDAAEARQWKNLWSRPSRQQPRAVGLFDEALPIDERRVLSVALNLTEANSTGAKRQLNLASASQPIKFIKSYSRSALSLLVLCRVTYCAHYRTLDGSTFQRAQAIAHPALLPIDAAFFWHAGEPHLVIAYDSEDAVPTSKIYRWSGTRMALVADVGVPSPKSVAAFRSGRSTLLLFTLARGAEGACVIYELGDQDSTHRLSSAANVGALLLIQPYEDAERSLFLAIDAAGSASILRWNGAALESLANLPDVRPVAYLVRIVQVDNETLLFVAYPSALLVYRLLAEKAVHLAELTLPSGQRVVDATAWRHGDATMVLLVKINTDGTFQTELWQLNPRAERPSGVDDGDDDEAQVRACLRELRRALDSRAATIERFRAVQSWRDSVNASESGPLRLGDLRVSGGSVSVVEFRGGPNVTPPSPRGTRDRLVELRGRASALKADALASQAMLSGNVNVLDGASIDEMHVDRLEAGRVNGEPADLSSYLVSGVEQRFATALSVREASIDELSVSSLCGYGFDHWMQVNDSARSSIANLSNSAGSTIVNDTIVIESDLIMKELKARRIGGVDWRDFLEGLFVIGRQQTIQGVVRYEGPVQVTRLYSERVNDVPSSDLITKPSNQSLRDAFIETLEVERLYVDKVNGVAIGEAARMSTENVIRGKVTLARLVITDELSVEPSIAIPLMQPIQDYERVHIDGDVFLRSLQLGERGALHLGGERLRTGVRGLAAGCWTRSGDQLIEAPVSLRRGATVDRLNCRYLNGLGERDFLYTDAARLADLENVTFASFRFGGGVGRASAGHPERVVEEAADLLTFRRAVRLRRLTVRHSLFTERFNGIPVRAVTDARPDRPPRLPGELRLETLRVGAGGMRAGELRVARGERAARRRRGAGGRAARRRPRHVRPAAARRRAAGLAVQRGQAERAPPGARPAPPGAAGRRGCAPARLAGGRGRARARGRAAGRAHQRRARGRLRRAHGPRRSGELAGRAGPRPPARHGDARVGSLNGRALEDLLATALSRAERQTLAGTVSFGDARLEYLTASAINGVDLSQLVYVDRPAVLRGDVTFSRLFVDGHVGSRTLNGQDVSQLASKLRRLPTDGLDNLLVQANVKWEEPSGVSHSLARLLDDAVTTRDDQLIVAPVTFQRPAIVESLYLSGDAGSEIARKISEIVADTVVDAGRASDPIAVGGTKIFKQALVVGDLEVQGNIDIDHVNGLDVRQVSSRIFRKDKAELVSADITFLDAVEIGRLITKANVHGVALQQLALLDQKMPKKLHFQDLRVDGNVSVHKLDGVDLDDFLKRRVTVDEDNEIFVDAEFAHSVQVLNGTMVASINQVAPESLVQNNADGTPIMVHGGIIFRSNLTVERNLETTRINGFEANAIYDNAVMNGAKANISGSLVFEGTVELSGDISVSGKVNGLQLWRAGGKKYLQNPLVQAALSKVSSLLNASLDLDKFELGRTRSSGTSVLYLEPERTFDWHFAGIQAIKSASIKDKTRLEFVTAEAAALCDLPSGCSCRLQRVVDVLPSGEYEIREESLNNLRNSFYAPEAAYELTIVSRSVSYSKRCSKSSGEHEHSRIFWFNSDRHRETSRRVPALLIDGYVSDAQIFQVEDQLYLIVAIFYNKEANTHATNSLLYRFDLTNGKTHLVQRIATHGARNVNVFQIPNVGIHLLIGCVKGRAESLLLRFIPDTRQFQEIRTFATGGSKHVASVSFNDKSFVILSNPDVSALQIFNYEADFDSFVDYQTLPFQSRVTSLGVFYSGDFGQSDAFVVTTTKDGWLYIYEYMFYGKFQRKMSYWADDIQFLTPFRHMSENYLFAGFKFNSTVYKVIQQGY
ncbi:LOW QUALITY PROTEIN: uncharacterized protein LOC131665180 [Phymastichus coffea]|uniref:LOW QUALITY PROTEIN: uncharacterized protein LOC131665180 n=1 Tax=Phymastichus coffea TaxID=108790 RepID=UPI00273C8EB0|nr:LOW QUALITY PROTEIN: uncharacterized protein LOC131665180 [Phymastichus coffea]